MESSGVLEIRLAFVLYGGVSLAVYMHGVCREIQELMIASEICEHGEAAEVAAGTTRQAYARSLAKSEENQGVPLRVVTDTIAGTSAGGIDAVYLAKALASDLSQEPLRDLWIQQGDIRKLVDGAGPVSLRLALFAARLLLPGRHRASPLKGGWMTRRLHEGLEQMEVHSRVDNSRGTLIASDQALDLFVTVTDGRGYQRFATVVPGGPTIRDTTHRHILHFRAQAPGQDNADMPSGQLSSAYNPALAFAARATSSFPGAFPAVTLDEFVQDLKLDGDVFNTQDFAKEFFPEYEAWHDDPRLTWFIDGGVLDNFPFGPAIQSIDRKPAGSEVNRHLIYVEPHPNPLPPAGKKPASALPRPGWLETILSALSGIPSHEPILDEILAIRDRNERISRIRSLARDSLPEIRAELARMAGWRGASTDYATVQSITTEVHAIADRRLGAGLNTYLAVRLQNIGSRLSDAVAEAFAYPATSSAAAFVREAVNIWLPTSPQAADGMERFLRRYDIAFRERRLLFLIQGLNLLYGQPMSLADRERIGAAKATAYGHLQRLWSIPVRMSADLKAGSEPLFGAEQLTLWLDRTPQEFVDNKDGDLHGFFDRVGEWLETDLNGFGRTLWASFSDQLRDWPDAQREELLARYLGFPLWDGISFPLAALSEVHQTTQIQVHRISPADAVALKWKTPKLRGTEFHNFAAFFRQDWRENDYLWGRLDAAEILTRLINPSASNQELASAFTAVMNEEADLPILDSDAPDSLKSGLMTLIEDLRR
jgi:patatin-related protein